MSFDLNSFLDSSVDGAFTKRPLVPAGDYLGVIQEFKDGAFRSGDRKDGGKWYSLNVAIAIDLTIYPAIHTLVGQDSVVVFHSVFLDLRDDGSLDDAPGRNRTLGQYRDALGQNDPSQGWNPRMMQGRPIRVKVKHRPYKDTVQEDVDAVAAP